MERSDSTIIHSSIFICHCIYSMTLNSIGDFKAG